MKFFGKGNNAVSRIMEEKFYDIVAKELEAGIKRSGLWVKAMANSKGDEAKAMSLYIEYRVQSIIDEEEIRQAYEDKLAEDKMINKAPMLIRLNGNICVDIMILYSKNN